MTLLKSIRLVCFVTLICLIPQWLHAQESESESIQYNRDVRPILSDKCFLCHGNDGASREADLRLDRFEDAIAEAGSGLTPITPGDPAASEILRRVQSTEDWEVMPPPDCGKDPLTADEIAILETWIAEGAVYQPHWAFVAPDKAVPPEAPSAEWNQSPLDQFVFQRIEERGLTPSPLADKRTLLRRIHLDLTGLPPTGDDYRAFLADESPQAYERVVDRLLASPRYGEHMTRYWLDAARYGDTHGLHLDNYREVWPWRDWVIRSFNDNMPWDKFIVCQLAGDLLPEATQADQIASGFNRMHVTTNEGGAIPEEVFVRNVVDRVSTTGTVFMGLSYGCAFCHDHKYDPISSEDFFSMYAFFNSLDDNPMDQNAKDHAPVIRVMSEEDRRRLEELEREINELGNSIQTYASERIDEQRRWENGIGDPFDSGWTTPAGMRVETSSDENAQPEIEIGATPPSTITVSGANPAKARYTIEWKLDENPVTALRLRVLLDPERPNLGGGRSPNGNAVLTEIRVSTREDGPTEADPNPRQIATAFADYSQPEYPVSLAIDGADGPSNGWAIGGHIRKEPRVAWFGLAEPIEAPGATLKIELTFESQFAQHAFGRFELATHGTLTSSEFESAGAVVNLLPILAKSTEERTPEESAQITRAWLTETSPEQGRALQRLEDLKKLRIEMEQALPTTLVSKELEEPRPAYLLKRGEYTQPDMERGPIDRAVPEWLPPFPDDLPRDRYGLAQWLVSDGHPLTARVTVNRFWQQVFGRGIVETSEDFGVQGSLPTHPELLDWLAVDFRENNWDVKRLMKMLVMSRTYRQASAAPPEAWQADPSNRWLARGGRYRLDAETLRDQALAVSGLIVDDVGGPGVKPPQPEGLWKAVGYVGSNTANFVADDSHDQRHRRSLYTFWKRTAPPPQMSTFDSPSREECVIRRERTNTPLQALLLLNDPQYVECAIGLAARTLQDHEADTAGDELVAQLFQTALGRPADATEAAMLAEFWRDRLSWFEGHPEEAGALVAQLTPTPRYSDVAEKYSVERWAALTAVANVVLNLDEFVTHR